MQARLKVVQENANLKQVKLLPVTVIGRAAECQLKIASTQVSRRHCRITVTDKEVLIEDLNSANGTYVNQERLPTGKPTVVPPGTTLHIGPAAFVVDYTPLLTLETMPTTVIKSSELPFLRSLSSESPLPMVETAAASCSVTPDQVTEMAPPKVAPGEIPVPTPDAEAVIPPSVVSVPEFLPPAPVPVEQCAAAAERVNDSDEPIIAPVAAPVETPVLERKTVVLDPLAKAKAIPAVPVAAIVELPEKRTDAAPGMAAQPATALPLISSEQTVTMPSPGEDTMTLTPAAVKNATPAPGFDFLTSPAAETTAAQNFGGFDFNLASAAETPPAAKAEETSSKPATAKKSLFGLFGKKDKPLGTALPAPPVGAVAAPAPTAELPSASNAAENPFGFFDVPAPGSTPAPAAAIPSPQPASTPTDDPFAFLK